MEHIEHEDPDSGHPSPHMLFNPDEITTSTPRRGRRPNQSPRPTPSTDYDTVNGVIEMVKTNKQLREANDEMKNQSMMSVAEFEEQRVRIAELEEEVRCVSIMATIDLRKDRRTDGAIECRLMDEEMVRRLSEMRNENERETKRAKEWEEKYKKAVRETETMVERTTNALKSNEAMSREKEGEMREEMERMGRDVDRIKTQLEEKENELTEEKRRSEEKELVMEGLREAKEEMERVKGINGEMEKEMEALRERMAEMQQSIDSVSTEAIHIRDLEQKIKDLDRRNMVAEQDVAEATKNYQDLKSIREEEMAETLTLKTKVYEQKSAIDNLRRVNEELEEKRKESVKTMEELRAKTEEGRRMNSEMEELRRDVERRRENQKRLEDELDIARKMSEDAHREVKRVREEREKEKEEGRLEWMNKELRDSEEVKRSMEMEREQLEKRVTEALAELSRYHGLYEELRLQYSQFQESAQHQYDTDLAEKVEELNALRDRLAEFENYPGKVVSVDGRYSEGRSVYDLLPIQLKDSIGQSTDEGVRRAVECCKSMMIKGAIEQREERGETPSTPSTLSHLPFLIERLEEIDMQTSIFKDFAYFVVGIFKKIEEEEEGTEELMSSIASQMEDELVRLEGEWMERVKTNEDDLKRLRRSEEERRTMEEEKRTMEEDKRRMEEEAIRADEGRKKTLSEMMDLRNKLMAVTAEKEKMAETAQGFRETHDLRERELDEAEEELEILNERCQRFMKEVDEKERKIRMLMEELSEAEIRMEDLIAKNSDQSRKLVDETSFVHNLERELRGKEKEVEKQRKSKELMQTLVQELTEGLRKHYEVYKRVKGRSVQRQNLLDRCVVEIDKTRRDVGRFGRLDRLEETIRSESQLCVAQDATDFSECRRLQRQINSAFEDKENS